MFLINLIFVNLRGKYRQRIMRNEQMRRNTLREHICCLIRRMWNVFTWFHTRRNLIITFDRHWINITTIAIECESHLNINSLLISYNIICKSFVRIIDSYVNLHISASLAFPYGSIVDRDHWEVLWTTRVCTYLSDPRDLHCD